MPSNKFDGLSIGQRSYIRRQYREGILVSELCSKYGVEGSTIINVIKASR